MKNGTENNNYCLENTADPEYFYFRYVEPGEEKECRNLVFKDQLPSGFILHDDLYVFDTQSLCMYQIPDASKFYVHMANKHNFIIKYVYREFKNFFKCDASKNFAVDQKRCHLPEGSKKFPIIPGDRPDILELYEQMQTVEKRGSSIWTWFWIMFIMFAILHVYSVIRVNPEGIQVDKMKDAAKTAVSVPLKAAEDLATKLPDAKALAAGLTTQTLTDTLTGTLSSNTSATAPSNNKQPPKQA